MQFPGPHQPGNMDTGGDPSGREFPPPPLSSEELSGQIMYAVRTEREAVQDGIYRQRQRPGRTYSRPDKDTGTGDFIIGAIIGGVASWFGFMTILTYGFGSSSLVLVPWGMAITAALLIFGIYLAKRPGRNLVMHGMVISLMLGIFFIGTLFNW